MNFQQQAAMVDRFHKAQSDYEKTLTLLRALKSGEVNLDCVTMTDDGWQVRSPAAESDQTREDRRVKWMQEVEARKLAKQEADAMMANGQTSE